jgi:putative phosphoserine phosphatase / 1-acylglycerol-3-phosphate O-acyltransferase
VSSSSSPFAPIDQHDWFVRSGRWFTRIAAIGADLDLPDTLTLPGNRPTILVGNHRSLFDLVATMAIFSKFGVSSRIQVRADLMEKGPGARLLRSIGCIPTSSSTRASAERASIETVQKGQLLSLMPEGRLCKPGEWMGGVGPGRPGVSRIALATDAVIVPVGFSGTELVWPRGKPPKVQFPRPKVTMRMGPAMELASTDHDENAEQVMDGLRSLLRSMGDPHALRDVSAATS